MKKVLFIVFLALWSGLYLKAQKPLRDSLAIEKYITKGNFILSTSPGFAIIDRRDTITWDWQKGREVVFPLAVGYLPTRNLAIFAGGGYILRSGSLAFDFNSYFLEGFVRFYPFDRFRRKLGRKEEVTFLHQPFMQHLKPQDHRFLFQSLYPMTQWGVQYFNYKVIDRFKPTVLTSKYPIQAFVYGKIGVGFRVVDGFVIQATYQRGVTLNNPNFRPTINYLLFAFDYFFPVKPKRNFWME